MIDKDIQDILDTSRGGTLQILLDKQKEFGSKFTRFGEMTEHEQQVKMLEFIGCLIEEIVEVRTELPIRKHWSKKRLNSPDWVKVKEELIDSLHFMLTLFLILDMDENEICGLYMMKNKVNHTRQKGGY
jgi:dimeric dUTPase (all-alpha-NTP-PPase superfamily)